MVLGVECVLPKVVSTQVLLLPCSSPAGFNQLVAGDFAMIDYTPSSCGSFCMQGIPVDITCFNPVYVGMGETKSENKINFYFNPTTNNLSIKTPQKATVDIFNMQGQIIKTLQTREDKTHVDVSALPSGMYILKLKCNEEVC
jgi:hypothetical protein